MKINTKYLGSTATLAMIVALGAPMAHAQATVDTELGATESIAGSADHFLDTYQEQTATTTGSVAGNLVTINLVTSSTLDDVITGVEPQADNKIEVPGATANVSSATFYLDSAPSSAGDTAAVATLQATEANVTATSSGDTHEIVIGNTDTGVRTLTGTALMQNNDITASATGNSGTSQINIDPGVDVTEAVAGRATLAIDETLSSATDSRSSADLLVSSSQEVEGAVQVSSSVLTASTQALIESVVGATVTVADSDQSTTTVGNMAENAILSSGTTADITGSTAVANLQNISGDSTALAQTAGSNVTLSAGNLLSDVADSTLTVSGNSQASSATGNDSTQRVSLDANTITGEPLSVARSTDSASATGGVQLSTAADAAIANVQGEDGIAVSATTSGNMINVFAADDVTDSTLEAAGNRQTASATGATTANTLSLTSGAELSATGAVASVQNADNSSIAASAIGNQIENEAWDDFSDSSIATTANAIASSATGADAANALIVSNSTNNVSLAENKGTVTVNSSVGVAQPDAEAGYIVTNDQARSGSVSASTLSNQIATRIGDDANGSTVTTDGNALSASATGQSADNTVDLAFNNLTGGIGTVGGMVAATANEQDLADGSNITARNAAGTTGIAVHTDIDSDTFGGTVSTSSNTVSATARGNVTTNNDVIVDATNVVTAWTAAPVIQSGTGQIFASGSFVSASSQVSGADILASQLDVTGSISNRIETTFGDDIQDSSTVVSDDNVLSASATANSAANAVTLGGANTAEIAASGAAANYQATTAAGSVTAEIGVLGSDAVAAFSSTNSAGLQTSQIQDLGGSQYTNNGGTVTYTFADTLTSEEQQVLLDAGFTNVGATTADWGSGDTIALAGRLGVSFNNPDSTLNNGDETLAINNFNAAGSAGQLNNAGVIVRLDDQIEGSTVSIAGNTIVGETTGNTAANATASDATTVTSLGSLIGTVTAADTDVVPVSGFDLATANLQDNAAALTSSVAGSFAIVSDADGQSDIENSTRSVANNLLQSYATANRATNTVDLSASNTGANTGLESVQLSNALVATTSDMDVVAEASSENSDLLLNANTNQSVANGNVATNQITLDVTNTAATITDATTAFAGLVASASDVLSSNQVAAASVSAAATSDVYNSDTTDTDNLGVLNGTVSMNDNRTIAQATANNATNGISLEAPTGSGTANMGRTATLVNVQSANGGGTSEASVDDEVILSLSNSGTVPVSLSSLSLDGNLSSALARGNVAASDLVVDGANVAAGAGGDATYDGTDITSAYQLLSSQTNDFGITGTTTQARMEIDMSNSGSSVTGSTLSVSENVATVSAIANTAVSSLSVGADAANVDASGMLGSTQSNVGAATATGGSAVSVRLTTTANDVDGLTGSSITVADNESVSNAVGNQTQNTLVAGGANITSGLGGSNASADAVSNVYSAGNALLSNQDNAGAITSTNTVNSVTIDVEGADDTVVAGNAAAMGSTLTVSGNVVEARGTANLALNNSVTLGGAGTSSSDASGLVGNFQINQSTGDVTVTASTSTTISLSGGTSGVDPSAIGLNGGSASLQDNSTLALARGNVSENVLAAEGSAISAGTSPGSASASSPDQGVLNASNGIINEQVQHAAINATISDASYRVTATSSTGTALNGASGIVGGNSMGAVAYGNVTTNRLSMASLNGGANDASTAVYSGQENSGSITASVSNGTIGGFGTGGVAEASKGVRGNSISATAVGNFATSSIARSTR